jgi:hypothetical protein
MGDAQANTPPLVTPTTRVVAHPALAMSPRDTWLPLLPQRGIVPRRGGPRLRTVGYMGLAENSPKWLLDGTLETQLARVGVGLYVACAPDDPQGRQVNWNDFEHVDVSLCLRADSMRFRPEFKPPTKLINAWVAGCVPLAGPEPGYLAIGTPDDTLFLAEASAEAVAEAVAKLVASKEEFQRLLDGGRRRAEEFCTASIVDRWWEYLGTVPTSKCRVGARINRRGLVAHASELVSRIGSRAKRCVSW